LQPGFSKGDWVRISDITEPVQIISVDTDAGTMVGKSGPFKMTFALNDVTGETTAPDQKKRGRGAGGNYSTRSLPTVDLRGMTVEEALEQVEAYLDSCVLNDLREVTLLHGKGTGVLRENIHKYLKHMRQVKQYRRGSLPEGGDGITVVTLRLDD
jgi:DNA mismatch repair protein MutS2